MPSELRAGDVDRRLRPTTSHEAVDADEASFAMVWQRLVTGDSSAVDDVDGDLGDERVELDGTPIRNTPEESRAKAPAAVITSLCRAGAHVVTVQR
jgi:hypothetical protein